MGEERWRDEARVKNLIVEVMDDLIQHGSDPDGIFYYKELPSLQRTAPTPQALEALTYAFRISGDQHYLEIAAPLDRPEGVRGGRTFADKYTSILILASEAAPRVLLDWCEYPFAAGGVWTDRDQSHITSYGRHGRTHTDRPVIFRG